MKNNQKINQMPSRTELLTNVNVFEQPLKAENGTFELDARIAQSNGRAISFV
jgi:hypothetical protein